MITWLQQQQRRTLQNFSKIPVSAELITGLSGFTVDLYKLFAGGDDNIFMSPYGVSAALLLTALGAGGDTELQIRTALGVDRMAKDDVHRAYKALQDGLNAATQGSTTLAIANMMFANLGLEVGEQYKKKSKALYDGGLTLVDFTAEPEKSRVTINKWVKEQTRDKIKDLIPTGMINTLTRTVLINAIYFKGDWAKQFDACETTEVTFKPGNRGTVDMMNNTLKVKYHEDAALGASAVELPYASGNVAMVFLLPDKDDGLSVLETKLNSENILQLCSQLSKADKPEVILGIPKFKMEASYELTKFLPKLGISDLFSEDKANLTEMLPKQKAVYVTDVIHKAFVEVSI